MTGWEWFALILVSLAAVGKLVLVLCLYRLHTTAWKALSK